MTAFIKVEAETALSADALRATILEKYNMSLGNGLGMLKDRAYAIAAANTHVVALARQDAQFGAALSWSRLRTTC